MVDRDQLLTILARAGYGARGIVYLVIGGLAVQTALGTGGQRTGSRGAIEYLLSSAFGTVAVALIGIGLVGYAIWRFVQSVADADNHGTDAKGLAIRGGLLISCFSHGLLAIYAFSLVFSSASGSSSSAQESGGGSRAWLSELMAQPYGIWLVAAVGLVVAAVGLVHFFKAWDGSFERHLQMTGDQMKAGRVVAIFGLAARGLVFLVIGGLIVLGAWNANPQSAPGLGEALTTLRGQPYGIWLYGFTALGLVAFGLYSLMQAVFRRVDRGNSP